MIDRFIKNISLIIPIKKYRKKFRKLCKEKIKNFFNLLSFKLEEKKINKQYQEKIKIFLLKLKEFTIFSILKIMLEGAFMLIKILDKL